MKIWSEEGSGGGGEGPLEPNITGTCLLRGNTSMEPWSLTWRTEEVLPVEEIKHAEAQGQRSTARGRHAQGFSTQPQSLRRRWGRARRPCPNSWARSSQQREARKDAQSRKTALGFLEDGCMGWWQVSCRLRYQIGDSGSPGESLSRDMSQKMKGRRRVRRCVRGERT